jgi:hypothetical protein
MICKEVLKAAAAGKKVARGKDFSFVVWLCITPVKLLIH